MTQERFSPKISVLMLAKNQESKLLMAAASVLEFPEAELILIEGSSTRSSQTAKILSQIYSPRVIICLQDDSGPAEGLNNGLDISRGEFIAVLNADDMYLPGALARVSSLFSQDDGCDLILGSGYVLREETLDLKFILSMPLNYKTIRRSPLRGSVFFHQGVFWRRDSYPNLRFNVENLASWDAEFVYEMLLMGATPRCESKPYALFRVHQSSISGSGRLGMWHDEWVSRMSKKVSNRGFGFLDHLFAFIFRVKKLIKTAFLLNRSIFRG